MIRLVGMSRITITLDDETLDELRSVAPPGEVSAFVLEAVRARLRRHPIEELLAHLDEVHGPLTDDELAQGRQWWQESKQRWSSTAEQSSP